MTKEEIIARVEEVLNYEKNSYMPHNGTIGYLEKLLEDLKK